MRTSVVRGSTGPTRTRSTWPTRTRGPSIGSRAPGHREQLRLLGAVGRHVPEPHRRQLASVTGRPLRSRDERTSPATTHRCATAGDVHPVRQPGRPIPVSHRRAHARRGRRGPRAGAHVSRHEGRRSRDEPGPGPVLVDVHERVRQPVPGHRLRRGPRNPDRARRPLQLRHLYAGRPPGECRHGERGHLARLGPDHRRRGPGDAPQAA